MVHMTMVNVLWLLIQILDYGLFAYKKKKLLKMVNNTKHSRLLKHLLLKTSSVVNNMEWI